MNIQTDFQTKNVTACLQSSSFTLLLNMKPSPTLTLQASEPRPVGEEA